MDRYYNDIWVSSNQGARWTRLTATAPFIDRDNFNGEVTPEGYIVVVGGYNNRETLNDVWISADGGYTWGQCNAEAQFSDRRWQMTVMNRLGYLFVAGGEQIEGGRTVKQSDVWRSTIPLVGSTSTAKNAISTACPGVRFPSCVSGLSCWPGGSVTLRANAAATCAAVTTCNRYPEEESSSSAENVPMPAPTTTSGGSELSGGMIALVVFVVLAVVSVVGWLLWRKTKEPQMNYSREEGLLGSTVDPTSVSSLPSDTPVTHS